MKFKSTTFQILQLACDLIKEKFDETFKYKKLTLEERIDWCSKQDYFDLFDFAIGKKYVNDKKHAHKVCDKYGAPKFKSNEK